MLGAMSDRTLVLLKPDAVERGLVGQILGRFEAKNLKVVALDLRTLDADTLARHYEEHVGKGFYADLVAFMEDLAQRYPGEQIHIVWDNLNIHFDGAEERWTRFNRRHQNRFHFHYTPIHASWVNQVELFFSILHRRVLRYAAYDDVRTLTRAVSGFIERWNRVERHPFRWVFKGYPSSESKAA